jgi:bifunctional oligoribonuclease and PAP phosphatase NrnA
MVMTELEQAILLARRATHVLVTFPRDQVGVAAGTALALMQALEHLGKRVDIVSAGFVLPGNLRFLPGIKRIGSEVNSLRKFIVSLDLKQSGLKDLSYNVEADKLEIYLTPSRGSFQTQDLTARSSDFTYNLIVTVDTPDLASLGDLFHANTEFFYQTTILNFDHTPTNEHFGQINLVDLNVPATADVVLNFLEKLDDGLITPDIATCLYASLSSASRSFTTPRVTPDTLAQAGRLVNLGARREEVVTHLFRTKKLPTLRLWGRTLARLKSDRSRKLVWSLLQPEDFIKSGAGEEELPSVVDELIVNAPEAGTIVLLYEQTSGTTSVLLRASPGRRATDLLKPFNPTGDLKSARAILPGVTVIEAEKKVIEHLKSVLLVLEE